MKVLSEDEDNKKEEEETVDPNEGKEEVKVEDEGTYLEEIAEENEEENADEKDEEKKADVKETDGRPPIDIFEVQKLSKKIRGQNKRVSLEIIDEKAKDSASKDKVNRNRSPHFEIACMNFVNVCCYVE